MNEVKDPYGFIMNPDQPPKKPIIDLSGAGMFKRALIVGAGIIFLIIIFVMGLNFLNKSSNTQNQKLLEIVQVQNEIIRISTSAQEKITDKALLYRAINAKTSVESSQSELISVLSARGVKVDDKKLVKSQNSENDALLVEGEQKGKFNETYKTLLDKQLADYKLQLEGTYESSSAKEKEIIQKAFNQIPLLASKDPS